MTRFDPENLFKVTYSEYANATSLHMADTMDCSVEKVCEIMKIVKALE